MAIIYFMGTVSGAHLNPAVTISFALRGDFPWRRVPGYVGAQLVGSVFAAGFLRVTFGNVGQLGITTPGVGISAWTATLIEVVLTVGLVSVILGEETPPLIGQVMEVSGPRCLKPDRLSQSKCVRASPG